MQLLSRDFPYVLYPIKPLCYQLQLLPPSQDSENLINAVRELKRRCALVLGATSCVYFEADGTWNHSDRPPVGGVVVSTRAPAAPQSPPQQQSEPELRECPDPPRGIEICRDEDEGCTYAALKCGKRPRWRSVRYALGNDGRTSRETVFVGSARNFYLYVRDQLNVETEDVPQKALGLPTIDDLYEERVRKLLRGRSFSCDVFGGMTEWTVQYSIWRERGKGWIVRVIGEQQNRPDPLEEPPVTTEGPFRTKHAVREFLDHQGLESEVEF